MSTSTKRSGKEITKTQLTGWGSREFVFFTVLGLVLAILGPYVYYAFKINSYI